MEKKLIATRIIAGILAAGLIIAIVIIIKDHKTITDLQNPAKQNITMQQDVIREDCTATDADSKARCADDLQHLSDLLAQFSKAKQAGAAATIPVKLNTNNVQIQTVPVK